jgi:glycosyltransferase involved in cell wall biosynthesis
MSKNSLPKILFVSRQSGLGGTERRLIDLSNSLHRLGYPINFIFIIDDKHKSKFFKIIVSTLIGRIFYVLYIIQKSNPDIVFSFDLETGIYVFWARLLRIKKFKIISGYGSGLIKVNITKYLLRKGLFLADLYVCNSLKAIISLKLCLTKPVRIDLIRNGLETIRLNSTITFEKVLLAKSINRKIIGYIGKFNNEKKAERIFYLAEYFTRMYPEHNLLFVIIGDGPNRLELLDKFRSLEDRVKKSILMPGEIIDAGVLSKYFEIGLLCSDTEGFPNVLIEYMYFGVPWISTNVGDVGYIIEKGNPGFLLNRWSISEFSYHLNLLLTKPELSADMSKEGKKIFKQEFTIDRMTNDYVTLIKSITTQ